MVISNEQSIRLVRLFNEAQQTFNGDQISSRLLNTLEYCNSTSQVAVCSRKDDYFVIKFNVNFISLSDEIIKSYIMHAICHSFPNCYNHGQHFRHQVDVINEITDNKYHVPYNGVLAGRYNYTPELSHSYYMDVLSRNALPSNDINDDYITDMLAATREFVEHVAVDEYYDCQLGANKVFRYCLSTHCNVHEGMAYLIANDNQFKFKIPNIIVNKCLLDNGDTHNVEEVWMVYYMRVISNIESKADELLEANIEYQNFRSRLNDIIAKAVNDIASACDNNSDAKKRLLMTAINDVVNNHLLNSR